MYYTPVSLSLESRHSVLQSAEVGSLQIVLL